MPAYDTNSTNEMLIAGFQFALEIDSVTVGWFKSVDGLSSTTEVIEHKVVDTKGKEATVKVPGRYSNGDVTLSKAMQPGDTYLWDWRQEVIDGKWKDARRNGSIVLYDAEGTELKRWNFFNAWPSEWKGSGLDSTSSDVVTEDLTIVHEGLEQATG